MVSFFDKPAFVAVAQPVFTEYCISCHGPEKAKGKLRLDSYEAIIKGGSSGPVVVAKKSAESDMIRRLQLPAAHDDHMPPDGKPQPTADDLVLLKWWIDTGASRETKSGRA